MRFDYTKVENLLIQAMHQLKTKQIMALLTRILESRSTQVMPKPGAEVPDVKVLIKIIVSIKSDLRLIEKANPKAFAELASSTDEVKELVTHLAEFSWDDWHKLMALKNKISELRDELVTVKTKEELSLDDQLIREQQEALEEQGKFKFNTNKKWKSI